MAKNVIGPDSLGRYYYKDKAGHPAYNLKSPLEKDIAKNYIQITKEEWDAIQPAPHVPTQQELALQEKQRQIASLKAQLSATDYIVLKIAEALAEGDSEAVTALEEEYATELANRKAWRAQINELE